MSDALHIRCGNCKLLKPETEFYRSSYGGKHGRMLPCKKCKGEYLNQRRKQGDPKILRKDREGSRRYYWKNRAARHLKSLLWQKRRRLEGKIDLVKERARHKLRYAVKTGKISKPDRCSDCNAQTVIHGHHPDYSKPFDVEWLCSPCHSVRHRKFYNQQPTPRE